MEISEDKKIKITNAFNSSDLSALEKALKDADIHYAPEFQEEFGDLLFLAAGKNNYELCKFLIEKYRYVLDGGRENRPTPLMNAISSRSHEGKCTRALVKLLSGDDAVDRQNKNGDTALMYACMGAGLFGSRKGNIKIVRWLLELGANLMIQNRKDQTAIGVADEYNQELRKKREEYKNRQMAKSRNAKGRKSAVRRVLVKNTFGVDVNKEIIELLKEKMILQKVKNNYSFDESGRMSLKDKGLK